MDGMFDWTVLNMQQERRSSQRPSRPLADGEAEGAGGDDGAGVDGEEKAADGELEFLHV